MQGIAQRCDDSVEVFTVDNGEWVVEGLFGEDFKTFGSPLLVTQRAIFCANAVSSS